MEKTKKELIFFIILLVSLLNAQFSKVDVTMDDRLLKNDDRANGEIFIATDGVAYSTRDIYISMCKFLGKPMPLWSVRCFAP